MNKIDMEIKSQILAVLAKEGVPVRKIILFGSRARGESREDSDYDLLVIVAKPLTFREKVEVSEKIRDRLVGLNIASDIVVKSEVDVEYYRNKIGSVVREALKEGVTI
nr:nucleotidyltransferase domain-containing protein [Candidatus Njordarchaeota archaeon]